jgi:hypothetical protein
MLLAGPGLHRFISEIFDDDGELKPVLFQMLGI